MKRYWLYECIQSFCDFNSVMILTLNVRLMRGPSIFSHHAIVRVLELSFTCSLCFSVYNMIYLDISVSKNALYKTFQMRVVLGYHDVHVWLPLLTKFKILYMSKHLIIFSIYTGKVHIVYWCLNDP